ncbi:putative SOS response-associated peptidase YedK [Asticcacaulis solisilvae]|nr:putative SOS response-associated peptidase YedK [Asticcacaulis solisilvae]MDR6800608.1 putative SOS response-associated peptidase YedK [Asticcacaulis sp. BE141]
MGMCGRYGGPAELAIYAGYFDLPAPFANLKQADNDMHPSRNVTVLAKNREGQFAPVEMRWGLIPSTFSGHIADWSFNTMNARLETVETAPAFAKPWAKKRRVIIPMERYFEWLPASNGLFGKTKKKQRVAITRADGKPMGVAGIYDHAVTLDGPVLSCAMLTRAPGPRMLEVHDREPVVIDPQEWKAWLNGSDDIDVFSSWKDDAFSLEVA